MKMLEFILSVMVGCVSALIAYYGTRYAGASNDLTIIVTIVAFVATFHWAKTA